MSNVERETKELVLEKSGTVITIFEYITGRDQRAIKEAYLSQAKISSHRDVETKKATVEVGGVSGSVNTIMEDLAIKAVVQSVKTKGEEVITDKEAILNFILDLRGEEYDIIIKAVNEVTEGKK